MKLVIDASVSVKWFLPETHDEKNVTEAISIARLFEHRETQVFAPPHWIAETIAVLARLEPNIASDSLLVLEDIAAKIVSTPTSMQKAITLAIDFKHHLFDTLYHAVAIDTGATLVTADQSYFAKAQSIGNIQLLSEFKF